MLVSGLIIRAFFPGWESLLHWMEILTLAGGFSGVKVSLLDGIMPTHYFLLQAAPDGMGWIGSISRESLSLHPTPDRFRIHSRELLKETWLHGWIGWVGLIMGGGTGIVE